MEKRYIEVEKVKEEIIEPCRHAMCMISEILVSQSKCHIDSDEAIRRIRKHLTSVPSKLFCRMHLEMMLEENSVTEEEIFADEEFDDKVNELKDMCEDLNEKLKKDLLDDSDVFIRTEKPFEHYQNQLNGLKMHLKENDLDE